MPGQALVVRVGNVEFRKQKNKPKKGSSREAGIEGLKLASEAWVRVDLFLAVLCGGG